MRLELDQARCVGHARCADTCPRLFDVDDEGFAVLLVTGPIPPELEEDATLAAEACPEGAITCAQ